MRRKTTWTRISVGFILTIVGLLFSCQYRLLPRNPVKVTFENTISTILEYRCLECHNKEDAVRHGGLSLDGREEAFSSGRHAPVIVPGFPEESLLYKVLVTPNSHRLFMPPRPERLWRNEVQLIRRWIEEGARWPSGPAGRLVRPQDWQSR